MIHQSRWRKGLGRLPRNRREWFDKAAFVLLSGIAVLVTIPFFVIMLDVIVKGVPGLSPTLFLESISNLGLEGGIRNAIVGTLELVGIASAVAIPLSIGAAVYTIEYAKQGRIQQMVAFTADVLAGVPSIVFGAFGYTFFVWVLGIGYSLLSGALTLALMMIPTVLRTTQESLRAVPVSLREASLALGATRWSTTWRVTLRACFPAIITGVLLAIARVAGETAPLIFTTGYNAESPWSIFDAVASLPFTIWTFATHPSPIVNQKAYTTAFVLITIVLVVDIAANWMSSKIGILVRKK
ncbi:MAG: phosphate ABC transporter permease PstA [Promethearchaeota archaeon]